MPMSHTDSETESCDSSNTENTGEMEQEANIANVPVMYVPLVLPIRS